MCWTPHALHIANRLLTLFFCDEQQIKLFCGNEKKNINVNCLFAKSQSASVTFLLLLFSQSMLWVRKDKKDKEAEVDDKGRTSFPLCSCMACILASRACRMPLRFLCRYPNYITVQSIQTYDRISVGTVVDDLCARGGVGKRDAMLPSLIYIEWS